MSKVTPQSVLGRALLTLGMQLSLQRRWFGKSPVHKEEAWLGMWWEHPTGSHHWKMVRPPWLETNQFHPTLPGAQEGVFIPCTMGEPAPVSYLLLY